MFVIEAADKGGAWIRRIRPTGGKGLDKWMWLRGTKPHIIRPKWAKALRFKTAYSPRTKPGAGGQYKGPGKATGPTVQAQVVHHPGTEPRKLPQAIARWARPFFVKQMKAAVKRGAKEV